MSRSIIRVLLFICAALFLSVLAAPTSASLFPPLLRHMFDQHDGYDSLSLSSPFAHFMHHHHPPHPHRSSLYPYHLRRSHSHARQRHSHPFYRHQMAAAADAQRQSQYESDTRAAALACQQREQRQRQQQQLEQQRRQQELDQLQRMIDALFDVDDDGGDGDEEFEEKSQLTRRPPSIHHPSNPPRHHPQSSSSDSGQVKSQRTSIIPQGAAKKRAGGMVSMSRTSGAMKADEQQRLKARPTATATLQTKQQQQQQREVKSQTLTSGIQSELPSNVGVSRLPAAGQKQPKSVAAVKHSSSDSTTAQPDSEPLAQSSENDIEELLATYDDAFREASQLLVNPHAAQGKAVDVSAIFPGMSGENLRVEIRSKEGADEAGRAMQSSNPVLVVTGEKHYEDKLVLRSDEVARTGRYGMVRRSWKIPTFAPLGTEASPSTKDKNEVDLVDIGSVRARFDRSTYTLTIRFFKRQTVEDQQAWPRIMRGLDEKVAPVRSTPGVLTLPIKMVGIKPKEEPIIIDFPEHQYIEDESEDAAVMDGTNVNSDGTSASHEAIKQQDTPMLAAPTPRPKTEVSDDPRRAHVSPPLTLPVPSSRPVAAPSHVEPSPKMPLWLAMKQKEDKPASAITISRVASPPIASSQHKPLSDFCATSTSDVNEEIAASDPSLSNSSFVPGYFFRLLLIVGAVWAGGWCVSWYVRRVDERTAWQQLRRSLPQPRRVKAGPQSGSTSTGVQLQPVSGSQIIDELPDQQSHPEQKAQENAASDDTGNATKPHEVPIPSHQQSSASPAVSNSTIRPVSSSSESVQSDGPKFTHSIQRDGNNDKDRDNGQPVATASMPSPSPSSRPPTSSSSSSAASSPSAYLIPLAPPLSPSLYYFSPSVVTIPTPCDSQRQALTGNTKTLHEKETVDAEEEEGKGKSKRKEEEEEDSGWTVVQL